MIYKGIFFDLYGTLLVYDDVDAAWADWLTTLHAQLRACGLSMSEETFAQRSEGFLDGKHPPQRGDGDLTVYERRVRALSAKLNLNLSDPALQKAAEASIEAWQAHVSLDPTARSVLKTLRSRKKVALISNFDHPPHVHLLLSRLGLTELFDAIVVSGDVGVDKPDPRIFCPALQKTGLEPGEVTYVGDNLDTDVRGALAAGMHPILIRRDEASEEIAGVELDATIEGVQVISQLSELVEIF